MKIVRYAAGRKTGYGILKDDIIHTLSSPPFHELRKNKISLQLSEVKLLAPCLPSKIVAAGVNYRSHAVEMKLAIPDEPLIFLKPPTAVIGPEASIVCPQCSRRVDYEGELAVVIKAKASHISPKEALDYVLGYTCFNDVTARDLQAKDKQWTRAKGFDTFAAIGPCIETELDPANVPLVTRLNGEVKQRSNTNDLIFSVRELVSFISHIMTLLPGDIIATGTTSGVGPMKPNDTVEIEIGPIGTLRNYVVAAEPENLVFRGPY